VAAVVGRGYSRSSLISPANGHSFAFTTTPPRTGLSRT